MVYRASAQANAGERALLVHGRDAATVNAALRRVLEPMMPDQALPEAVAVRTLMSATIVVERVVGWLSAAVALLALALTAASLFGQITWQLDRRLNEFGIRAAIGATPAAIRKLIVSGIGGAVGLGVGVGLLGTWFTATSVSAIAFRASPLDLRVLLATGIVIVGVAMTAVLGPCRRAAAVNPAGVLRND